MIKMLRKTTFRKVGAFSLLILMSFYLGGISYFYHFHIVNGNVITHSYPCDAHHSHHYPFADSHNDSHCTCNFENDPSIFFSDEYRIEFYDLNPALFLLDIIAVEIKQTQLISVYFKHLSLRAPPCISFF